MDAPTPSREAMPPGSEGAPGSEGPPGSEGAPGGEWAPLGGEAAPGGEAGSEAASRSEGPLRARNVSRDTVLAADLESADSLWAKFMGLMGRPTLEPGAGMWLPDSNGIHMMFMRFAIDAVFVGKPSDDGARPVVALRSRLPAWRGMVPLIRGAHGVLELPVGTIEASGTAVGDRIALDR